jgi:hypothetical protein
MKRKQHGEPKRRRLPAKPCTFSVEVAARAFDAPQRAIEIAQKIGELPLALTLTAMVAWKKRRAAR